MFRLRDDLAADVKRQAMEDFRSGILALPEIIPTIRKIEVGFNVNPAEKWDICLNGEFDTLADVVTYGSNPAHVKVAGALKPYLAGRSCVDYEVS